MLENRLENRQGPDPVREPGLDHQTPTTLSSARPPYWIRGLDHVVTPPGSGMT